MLPTYFPRAQFSGSLKWSCVWCGNINTDSIRPGTTRLKCGKCERHFFYGVAFHIPMNAATKLPKDVVVPSWAGEEYPFDTIPKKLWNAIPPAFFDPERKVKQRGRVHVILLEDSSIYLLREE